MYVTGIRTKIIFMHITKTAEEVSESFRKQFMCKLTGEKDHQNVFPCKACTDKMPQLKYVKAST